MEEVHLQKNQGWIKLHRSITDHWIWSPREKFDRRSAWIDLLLMVNHAEKKVRLGQELIQVDPGERITSVRKLAERWGWSRSKVSRFLKLLQRDGMVEVNRAGKKTIINICNYKDYQQKSTGKMGQRRAEKRADDETNMSTNKNEKNEKNIVAEEEGEEEKAGGGPAERGMDLIGHKFIECFGYPMTPTHYRSLLGYLKAGMAAEVVCRAFDQAIFQNKDNYSYIKGILNNWHRKGVKTLAEANALIKKHEEINLLKLNRYLGKGGKKGGKKLSIDLAEDAGEKGDYSIFNE